MRDPHFTRPLCALLVALSAAISTHTCRAAFLTVFGGPTYSQSTGGYLPTTAFFNPIYPLSSGAPLNGSPLNYGSVNNAGVAVGNLDRINAPLTSTLQNVFPSVATWSATSSPVILSAASSADVIQAKAINNAGVAVGIDLSGQIDQRSTTSSSLNGVNASSIPARWNTPNTALTPLTNLGLTSPPQGTAVAINAQGIAVGSVIDPSGGAPAPRAVRWDSAGVITELGALPNQDTSNAFAVNSSNITVGSASFPNIASTEPVRWDAAGNPTLLGNLNNPSGQSTDGAALSINSSGTAVGYVYKIVGGNNLGLRAVRWDAATSTATELGTLGANANSQADAFAVAINNSGITIGEAYVPSTFSNFDYRAVRWDPGSTTAIVLNPLSTTKSPFATGPTSTADAINSSNIVVGSAQSTTGIHAVYWNPDGTVVDLNSLIDPNSGWTLTAASAISDTNWIVGVGNFDPDGNGPLTS